MEDEVLMTGDVIDKAFVSINPQTNEAEVLLHLNSIGSRQFERITGQNVERQLAIVLDNVVQSSPRINERIPGGQASITGSFTPEESHLLAIVLRAGALPAPLHFLEERTVGSMFGADSIRQGVSALLFGAGLLHHRCQGFALHAGDFPDPKTLVYQAVEQLQMIQVRLRVHPAT